MKSEALLAQMVTPHNVDQAFAAWLNRVAASHSKEDCEKFERAFNETHQNFSEPIAETGEPWASHVLSVASVLCDLNLDTDAIVAALLLPHADLSDWDQRKVKFKEIYGEDVPALIDGTWRMRDIQLLPQGVDAAERSIQAEHLRKMLLSMVEDIRVVLIKLAERLQTLRMVSPMEDSPTRQRIAREVSELFAPLANRLGIWQVKWELEDLSLRILAHDE
ncbi:MAG: HD domain-containing protein, partial [Burkholderiales bacterium]|nr:HD domain-containing protein [Burkholderiales bacterium]